MSSVTHEFLLESSDIHPVCHSTSDNMLQQFPAAVKNQWMNEYLIHAILMYALYNSEQQKRFEL